MTSNDPLFRNRSSAANPGAAGHAMQSGYALVFSLIILMILTILGVTVMNMNALEFRMAGNTQESVRSFQVAESGLRQAIADEVTYSELADPDMEYAEPKLLSNGPISFGSSSAVLYGTIACWRCDPVRSKKTDEIQSARQGEGAIKYTTYQVHVKGTTPFGTQNNVMQNIIRKSK